MGYNEYVINNGKFIGKFDEMYQKFDDPWNQSKSGYVKNSISRLATISFLNQFKISSVVEFGCGLGHFTNFISSNVDLKKQKGVDFSATAIEKAKINYPHLNFQEGNVSNIGLETDFECFLFSEIVWYILEDNLIVDVFNTMKSHFRDKYFINNLVFYKGQQQYGLNYFTKLSEFIRFCPFELIGKVESDISTSDTIETCTIFKI